MLSASSSDLNKIYKDMDSRCKGISLPWGESFGLGKHPSQNEENRQPNLNDLNEEIT